MAVHAQAWANRSISHSPRPLSAYGSGADQTEQARAAVPYRDVQPVATVKMAS